MKKKQIIFITTVTILGLCIFTLKSNSWQQQLKNTDYIYLDIVGRENPIKYQTSENKEMINRALNESLEISYHHNFFPMYLLSFSTFTIEIKLEEELTLIKVNNKYFKLPKEYYYEIKNLLNDNYDTDEFYNRIQYYKDSSDKESSALELLSSIHKGNISISNIIRYSDISEFLGGVYYIKDNIKYFAVIIIDKNRVYFISENKDEKGEISNRDFAKIIYNNSVLGSHDH